MTLALPVVVAVALLLAQGVVLQFSVAITGEAAPRYGRALTTAWLAGLASALAATAWGCTVGSFVDAVNRPAAATIAVLLALGASTLVLRRRLGVSTVQAGVIALIHETITAALAGAAAWIVSP